MEVAAFFRVQATAVERAGGEAAYAFTLRSVQDVLPEPGMFPAVARSSLNLTWA